MSLVKYDPFRGYSTLARRMDSFFDAFNDSFMPAIRGFAPSIDVSEDENHLYFYAEMPGIKKDDLKVTINDDNVLVIKGKKERKDEEGNDERAFWRSERSYGEFTRTFELPDNIDSDNIDAKYQDGVLNITLNKKEPEKPKEKLIAIN